MTSYPVLFAAVAALWASALATPAAAAPVAATARAQASVTLVEPISVIKRDDLDFGHLSATGAGTAVLNPATGSVTTTGGVQAVGGQPSPAIFLGASRGWTLVWIRLPNQPLTLVRSGGTETLTVTNWTLQGSNLRLLGPSAAMEIKVGGTLNVGANQADGLYTGTFDINVDYY